MLGKLPPSLLLELLSNRGERRPEVLVGPSVGEDAAVIDLGGRFLVVTSDPIVGASEEVGFYLVHVNANDLASKGAEPAYLVLDIIAPPWGGPSMCLQISRQVSEECKKLGVAVVGGHTEVSDRYQHPVAVGTMLGFADRLLKADAIRPGHVLLMTKHAGIEGMTILAAEGFLDDVLSEEELEEVLSWRSKISVLPESRALRGRALYMHDPTEGGVMGGIYEMTIACGLSLELDPASIPVHPLTAKAAASLGFDPLRLISSGVLLAVVPAEEAEGLASAVRGLGIPCSILGRFVEGKSSFSPTFGEELWRILGSRG